MTEISIKRYDDYVDSGFQQVLDIDSKMMGSKINLDGISIQYKKINEKYPV